MLIIWFLDHLSRDSRTCTPPYRITHLVLPSLHLDAFCKRRMKPSRRRVVHGKPEIRSGLLDWLWSIGPSRIFQVRGLTPSASPHISIVHSFRARYPTINHLRCRTSNPTAASLELSHINGLLTHAPSPKKPKYQIAFMSNSLSSLSYRSSILHQGSSP